MASTIIPMHAKTVVVQTTLPITEVIRRLDAALHKSACTDIMQRLAKVENQDQLVATVNEVTQGNDFLYFSQLPHHRLLSIHDGPESPKPTLYLYTIGNPLIAQRIIRLNPLAASHIPPRILIAERHPDTDDYDAYNYQRMGQCGSMMNGVGVNGVGVNGVGVNGVGVNGVRVNGASNGSNSGSPQNCDISSTRSTGTVVSYTLPSSVMMQSPYALGVGLVPDRTDLCQLRKEVFGLDEKIERLVRGITTVDGAVGVSGGAAGVNGNSVNGSGVNGGGIGGSGGTSGYGYVVPQSRV